MVACDIWHADDGYSAQGEELGVDVTNWPTPKPLASLTLRLEELTHFDVKAREEAKMRNMMRLGIAQDREDVNHLEVHYTCCVDKTQRIAIEELLSCDERKWKSFTMIGINGIGDVSGRPAAFEELMPLFLALRSVEVLNLYSCSWFRGHGLDVILSAIPLYKNLRELRLQGWQMDRVSTSALQECLCGHDSRQISLLSLRSCAFLGGDTFGQIVKMVSSIDTLDTLNMSYCSLRDSQIVYLVEMLRTHGALRKLHLGGNECGLDESVSTIADWLSSKDCQLRDINLRALWTAFSDDGLLQRSVHLCSLFSAIRQNVSLERLALSESQLEDNEIACLIAAIQGKSAFSHLDVSNNPFSNDGASSLLLLAKRYTKLQSIRFENDYVSYKCADSIKVQTRINLINGKIQGGEAHVPLSLWPRILQKVQDGTYCPSCTDKFSPELAFHLLQSTTGVFGLPLSVQAALQLK